MSLWILSCSMANSPREYCLIQLCRLDMPSVLPPWLGTLLPAAAADTEARPSLQGRSTLLMSRSREGVPVTRLHETSSSDSRKEEHGEEEASTSSNFRFSIPLMRLERRLTFENKPDNTTVRLQHSKDCYDWQRAPHCCLSWKLQAACLFLQSRSVYLPEQLVGEFHSQTAFHLGFAIESLQMQMPPERKRCNPERTKHCQQEGHCSQEAVLVQRRDMAPPEFGGLPEETILPPTVECEASSIWDSGGQKRPDISALTGGRRGAPTLHFPLSRFPSTAGRSFKPRTGLPDESWADRLTRRM
ncbi:hypothetical protein EYF80_025392 [Liparis tanakae]|uniref:Uncharacterized protein n=1 Tax=Liparis tanakae TaxID=230148 RepID=A0A4Z2HHY1_9TELE|nr:hypothetical protein EYF80_025392 [Liparis tanakae]